MTPLAVAAPPDEVAAAVLRVLARLPGGRVLERGGGRVRARAVSRLLRLRTEVVVVATAGAVHLRIAGPRGVLDPRTLRERGRDVLAAIDAELRGWEAPDGGWLRR